MSEREPHILIQVTTRTFLMVLAITTTVSATAIDTGDITPTNTLSRPDNQDAFEYAAIDFAVWFNDQDLDPNDPNDPNIVFVDCIKSAGRQGPTPLALPRVLTADSHGFGLEHSHHGSLGSGSLLPSVPQIYLSTYPGFFYTPAMTPSTGSFPGAGAPDGASWRSYPNPTDMTLVPEDPDTGNIPEPATCFLMALGGLAVVRLTKLKKQT